MIADPTAGAIFLAYSIPFLPAPAKKLNIPCASAVGESGPPIPVSLTVCLVSLADITLAPIGRDTNSGPCSPTKLTPPLETPPFANAGTVPGVADVPDPRESAAEIIPLSTKPSCCSVILLISVPKLVISFCNFDFFRGLIK